MGTYMASDRTTVMNLCVARAVERYGMVKGARMGGLTTAYIVEWAAYQAATGHDPGTALEYGRWANVPQRTAYRRLHDFRELFPEHETPAPLAGALLAIGDRRHPRALPA
jgi:hypothetical protein